MKFLACLVLAPSGVLWLASGLTVWSGGRRLNALVFGVMGLLTLFLLGTVVMVRKERGA